MLHVACCWWQALLDSTNGVQFSGRPSGTGLSAYHVTGLAGCIQPVIHQATTACEVATETYEMGTYVRFGIR